MESLHQLETSSCLLAAVLALTTFAQQDPDPLSHPSRHRRIDPGGVAGSSAVTLSPDLVFLVFLPPILWAAAYFTSLREFRHNLGRSRCWRLDSSW